MPLKQPSGYREHYPEVCRVNSGVSTKYLQGLDPLVNAKWTPDRGRRRGYYDSVIKANPCKSTDYDTKEIRLYFPTILTL